MMSMYPQTLTTILTEFLLVAQTIAKLNFAKTNFTIKTHDIVQLQISLAVQTQRTT